MNLLRKISVGILAFLLSTTLFSMAWTNISVSTLHDRQTVKGWFDKSGFYNQIVDVILEKAKTGATDQTGSLPIDDPAIQTIAKQAFTPELLKTSVENVLNGGYDWLGGKTDKLDFTIDLTAAKQQLAAGIGSYVTNRVTSLPVCALGLGNQSYDGFSATCRPKALTAADAGKQAEADFLKQDFLKDPVITASSLKVKDTNGTEIPLTNSTNAATAKTLYGLTGELPIALGVISLLLALGIVFTSRNRLRGIRRVGYLLLSNGILLLLFYVVLGVGYEAASNKIVTANTASPKLIKLVLDFGKVILTDVKAALVWYIGGFIGLGILAIVLTLIIKKGRGGDKPKNENDKLEPPMPETKIPQTPLPPAQPVMPRPRPKTPRKIQL